MPEEDHTENVMEAHRLTNGRRFNPYPDDSLKPCPNDRLTPCPDRSGRPAGDRLTPCRDRSGRPAGDRLTPCRDRSGRPAGDRLTPCPDRSGRPAGDRLTPCRDRSGRPAGDRLTPCPDRSGRPAGDRLTLCPDRSGRPAGDSLTPCPDRPGRPPGDRLTSCPDRSGHPAVGGSLNPCPDRSGPPERSRPDPCLVGWKHPGYVKCDACADTDDTFLGSPRPSDPDHSPEDCPKIVPYAVAYPHLPPTARYQNAIVVDGTPFRVHMYHTVPDQEETATAGKWLSENPLPGDGFSHHDQEEDGASLNNQPENLLGWFEGMLSGRQDNLSKQEHPVDPPSQLPCSDSRSKGEIVSVGSAVSSPDAASCTETAHPQPPKDYTQRTHPESSDTSIDQDIETTHEGLSVSENCSNTTHLKPLEVDSGAEATLPRAPVSTQQEPNTQQTNPGSPRVSQDDNRRQHPAQSSASDVIVTMETSGDSLDSDITRTTGEEVRADSEEDREKKSRKCLSGWKFLKVSDVLWGLIVVGVIVGLVVVLAYPNGPTTEGVRKFSH
ncbi:uncharacterized protein [Branchiostoma lanceolatum]|uniref:uncharacterized protein n=1 Tax=Branchiostoma lanceolatum TaxID=7740 RepID=UPI003452B324